MKNKFNRCCCVETVEHTYIGQYTKRVEYNYFMLGRHRCTYDISFPIYATAYGVLFGMGRLPIPRGRIIQSAVIQFSTNVEDAGTDFMCRIQGDKLTHTTVPETFFIYDADKTDANVEWNLDGIPWHVGEPITTPDISHIVQEIINDTHWNTNQYLFVYIEPIYGWRWVGGVNAGGTLIITY